MTPFAEITRLFSTPEARAFYGEEVTIAQHMLQAAALAQSEGAPRELVVSALLHDIGHLTEGIADDVRNRDHAEIGMEVLKRLFAAEVYEPVRLHVLAKRYLVATDPAYHEQLSPASVATLKLQGGPMNSAECEAFIATEHADAALTVRRWDEAAKDPGAITAPLASYQQLIEELT